MKTRWMILIPVLTALCCTSCMRKHPPLTFGCRPAEEVFGEVSIWTDPANRFIISIPASWSVREVFSDTIYGIMGVNYMESREDPARLLSLSVTGYHGEGSLADYFSREAAAIREDPASDLWETGWMPAGVDSIPWMLFRMKGQPVPLVNWVVIRTNHAGEFYHIQATTAEGKDALIRICELSRLTQTFELLEEEY
ncbi:MAG: hypothetical protein JW861_05115 [Bacteroidales bacterium]|nr:hypothetical protein [Bacteroidales bacterium]